MKNVLKFLLVLIACQLTGCAPAEPLSPIEYTQLLVNVKEFFALSILLLNQDSPHCIGQAISRIYYGHYHIARLIYNNKRSGNTSRSRFFIVLISDLDCHVAA